MLNLDTQGKEVDLLINYPKINRNLEDRIRNKNKLDQKIARKFGKEFFDGDRRFGYGGFVYDYRFWGEVVPTFKKYWQLQSGDSFLDVGCAKGFMLYDLKKLIPEIKVYGVDISDYAVNHAKEEVKEFCQVANAINLPFDDKSIDVSISITTLHNLAERDIATALLEIERVTKRGSFITLDAYSNEKEKERMEAWNLTAKTVMHVDRWKEFFNDIGYTGDYYWFIP
jgi:SAM-dependent methyltransferase